MHQLKRCGVSGQLLVLILSFLKDRKQRAVPNGRILAGEIFQLEHHRVLLGRYFFLCT